MENANNKIEKWDLIIKPQSSWLSVDLVSIWKYRDLLMLLVKRDFVSVYKQTLLGPFWFIIQPVITTVIFTVIFGNLASISTDGIPPTLFYISGITLWAYFADCLTKTSNTFIANAAVFGKVYFPRLIVPLSVLISNLWKLGIQLVLFIAIWVYYLNISKAVSPNWTLLWLFPFLIIIMAGLGLGFGILISSLTTKYRDLTFLVGFGVQLLMYASPIVYPISALSPKMKFWLMLNPISSIIETFKYVFLGSGYFSGGALIYSFIFMLIILSTSVLIFNRVEKTFMDSV
ncbi:MAG: ABC transporter permease [Bacteroidetes bacterium]|nr:ABC transporter permease [Bacteroidota bacterium]